MRIIAEQLKTANVEEIMGIFSNFKNLHILSKIEGGLKNQDFANVINNELYKQDVNDVYEKIKTIFLKIL